MSLSELRRQFYVILTRYEILQEELENLDEDQLTIEERKNVEFARQQVQFPVLDTHLRELIGQTFNRKMRRFHGRGFCEEDVKKWVEFGQEIVKEYNSISNEPILLPYVYSQVYLFQMKEGERFIWGVPQRRK